MLRPNPLATRLTAIAAGVILLLVIVNPVTSINILALGVLLLVAGSVFLREKFLLLFLVIRPALDAWRDVVILNYRDTNLTVTAAISIFFFLWSLIMTIVYWRDQDRLLLRLPLALFTLLLVASALWSVAPFTSILESIKWLNLVALFWLTYLFVKKGKLTKLELAGAIALSAIIPLLAGLWQLAAGTGLATFDIRGRLYGTLAHPNVFAFFLLALIIMHIQYSLIAPLPFWKNYARLRNSIFVFLGVLLLFTYTRAAYLGLAVFLLILGLYKNKKLLRQGFAGIIVLVLAFFSINQLFLITNHVNLEKIPVIGRLTTRNEDADSLAWRAALLEETIPIIAARPWFGYGYGTFESVWSENRSLVHQWDDSAEAHNDYLRITLELGLAGLAFYLVFLGCLSLIAYRLSRKNPPEYVHLFAWVITFIILSLSDNMLHHTPVMWLTFAWWGAALAAPPRSLWGLNFLN